MRPFEQFVAKSLEDFESESDRRSCMTCAREFAVYLMEGEATRTPPRPRPSA